MERWSGRAWWFVQVPAAFPCFDVVGSEGGKAALRFWDITSSISYDLSTTQSENTIIAHGQISQDDIHTVPRSGVFRNKGRR